MLTTVPGSGERTSPAADGAAGADCVGVDAGGVNGQRSGCDLRRRCAGLRFYVDFDLLAIDDRAYRALPGIRNFDGIFFSFNRYTINWHRFIS